MGWNIVEGLVAVSAGLAATSVALIGFGADSFVESASGVVSIWRLNAEKRGGDSSTIELVERRAHRLVALSLFLLAAYVAGSSLYSLVTHRLPEVSIVGIVLTTVSIGVMRWLAREKSKVATALGSKALEADSFQTTACWWLSVVTLTGIALNALFGWWWADPVAALIISALVIREGREAWLGESCCG